MSDSPRLTELRRQRALLQQHLAWIDREIANEANATNPATVGSPSDPTPSAPRPASGLIEPKPASVVAADVDADAILADYQTPTSKLQHDVRFGCFLYFAAALLAVAAGVVVLYFLLRHA